MPLRRALPAEFIATFVLVFVGVGAIANLGGDLLGIALAHGLAIGIMATATGAVSGGHINPAVSIAFFLRGRLSGAATAGYVAAQCLGALAGAAAVKGLFSASVLAAVGMGTPAPGAAVGVAQALGMEIALTFFVVYTIFCTAVDRAAPKVGGLYIGLAVAMGILAGGPISGAAMNPARHLGPALLGGGTDLVWLYW
ncbi:aquaporin, partial [bacterium]|nr:aquaporin [bacterium]